MFLAMAALAVLFTTPLFGGSLRRLATVSLAGGWLIWVALGTQIAITELPHLAGRSVLDALHLATYVAAGVFLWLNRRLPGLGVLALGGGLNAVTIAINGGTLPASAGALRAAGIHPARGFDNSGVLAHPHLAWLGDTMATPSWLPLRNVLSIGDLVIVAGVILLVHGICQTYPWRLATQHLAVRRRQSLHATDIPTPGSPTPGSPTSRIPTIDVAEREGSRLTVPSATRA